VAHFWAVCVRYVGVALCLGVTYSRGKLALCTKLRNQFSIFDIFGDIREKFVGGLLPLEWAWWAF